MSGQSKIDFVFPLGLQSLSLKQNFYKDFNYLWYINVPDWKKKNKPKPPKPQTLKQKTKLEHSSLRQT